MRIVRCVLEVRLLNIAYSLEQVELTASAPSHDEEGNLFLEQLASSRESLLGGVLGNIEGLRDLPHRLTSATEKNEELRDSSPGFLRKQPT